jgi:hypothetical protein
LTHDIFLVLIIGSQIANLTPNHSFDHNLIIKFPNGGCTNILDIYIWRSLWKFKEGSIWIFFFLFALLFDYFRNIRSVEAHFFTLVGVGLSPKTFSQCAPPSCFTFDHEFKVILITLVYVFVPWTTINTCECGLHYHTKICEFLISVNIAHFFMHIVG